MFFREALQPWLAFPVHEVVYRMGQWQHLFPSVFTSHGIRSSVGSTGCLVFSVRLRAFSCASDNADWPQVLHGHPGADPEEPLRLELAEYLSLNTAP